MPDARVLIAVKAYPLPSSKYEELVCTAGVLENGRWIRIYPIPFRSLPYGEQYRKFEWIRLNLVKNAKDFRPESYRPRLNLDEPIILDGHISASPQGWEERKSYVLREVFDSMSEVIRLAKGPELRSLAVLKPREIIDFTIEPTSRRWKKKWDDYFLQSNLFEQDNSGEGKRRVPIKKLPYKYSYVFMSEGDSKPHKLLIEDWELGALYWNCLTSTEGVEEEANRLVRRKYLDEFCSTRDIYLFLGTTWQYHRISLNPFIIIGVFYPPKQSQKQKATPIQLNLF
ncbi:MAG: hypothetical protein IRZ31_01100 [Thermogemmatispora sp.]|nr:hypothetical protein [Thermogemmatispora sp.]